jgi:hypothetical protein
VGTREAKDCFAVPKNSPILTSGECSLRAAIAVETSWANTQDRTARTQPGRDAAFAKFEAEIDEKFPGLDPAERRRRAEHLRRAHMKRLALKSAKARRLKKAG